jgi:hypothetical protein
VGAVGVWLGYPQADPIVGLLIAAAILVIVWQSGKTVFTRLLDGVDPEMIDEIRHAAGGVEGVEDVAEVRARWLGHRLRAEVNVAVDPELSVEEGHAIAREVNHRLLCMSFATWTWPWCMWILLRRWERSTTTSPSTATMGFLPTRTRLRHSRPSPPQSLFGRARRLRAGGRGRLVRDVAAVQGPDLPAGAGGNAGMRGAESGS